MRRPLSIVLVLLLSAGAVQAGTQGLTDRNGRWICTPANPAWPQVLIDFEEDAYRRCDQNTCVTYPIMNISADEGGVRINFSHDAALRTQDAGGPYRESMTVAGTALVTTGQCAFHGTGDIYPSDRLENAR